jgi:hypothetical protein
MHAHQRARCTPVARLNRPPSRGLQMQQVQWFRLPYTARRLPYSYPIKMAK